MIDPDSFFGKLPKEDYVRYQKIIYEGKNIGVYSNPDEAVEFLNKIIEYFENKKKEDGADQLGLDLAITISKWLLRDAEKQKKVFDSV